MSRSANEMIRTAQKAQAVIDEQLMRLEEQLEKDRQDSLQEITHLKQTIQWAGIYIRLLEQVVNDIGRENNNRKMFNNIYVRASIDAMVRRGLEGPLAKSRQREALMLTLVENEHDPRADNEPCPECGWLRDRANKCACGTGYEGKGPWPKSSE